MAIGPASSIYFVVDGNGNCVGLDVYNDSANMPMAP
jgi:hypothetical protein